MTTLIVAVASSAVVYVITLFLPKTYTSQQVLLFPASQGSAVSIANSILGSNQSGTNDVSSFSSSLPGGISTPIIGSSPQTASGILASKKCRAFVAQNLDLQRRWKLSNQKTLEELARKTSMNVDNNGFLVISCLAEDPTLARDIVREMYRFLDSGAVELTINLAKRNRKVMTDRLKVSETRMQEARVRLVNTVTNHPYLDSAPIQNILATSFEKLSDAKVALSGAKARIQATEGSIRSAIARGATVESLLAANGGEAARGMEDLIKDLQKRRLDLEDVRQSYTEKSPEFKAAFDKNQSGKKTIQKMLNESKSSLDSNTYGPLIQAKAELKALSTSVDGYEKALRNYKLMALKTPGDASIVKIAQAQFDTALKTTEALRFQLEQATIAEERDPARFEVIDEADINPEPVAPRKGLITGAWAAFICAIGAWIIVRQRLKFVD